MSREVIIKALLCVLGGTLFFLSCARFDIWPLCWIAAVPILWVTQHPTTQRPWAYGLLAGTVANGGGFYWLVPFMGRFGHLPVVASIPIFLLCVTYQAITFALFAQIVRRLGDTLALPLTLLAPIVWVAVEVCVPYVFPWYLAITQAWVPPVIQVAELTGPLGVSFLLVLGNAALYELLAAKLARTPLPLRRAGIAAAVIAACVVFGFIRLHQVDAARAAAPKLKVGVVQANIGINEKWQPRFAADQLAVHQRVSIDLQERGAELVIWPESSYPYAYPRNFTSDWPEQSFRRARRGFTVPLLLGTLTLTDSSRDPYNTAMLIDSDSRILGKFDKTILMVFGEYIPFYEQMKFVKDLIPAMSNFARGTEVTTFPLTWTRDGVKGENHANIAPMICYEDIFPSFGRRVAKLDPNLLVNITNDAWFGDTSEPYEHMALSVFRAVELRLDLVRAVNTGVSSVITASGRVQAMTRAVDPDEEKNVGPMSLLEDVAILPASGVYSILGEWFGGLCLLIVIGLWLRARAKSGVPLRVRPMAIGAASLFLILTLGLVLGGGQRVLIGWRLLCHMAVPGVDDAVAFSTGVWMIPLLVLGCFVLGALVRRLGGARPEMAVAVLVVMVVPALLLGTLEGEQAGLVIAALLGVALALLGGKLLGRGRVSGATPAP